MTTVSLAVALLVMRGLREGFLPGERVALSSAWLLPAAIQWLNATQLPVGSLVLLACFGYLLARMRRGLDEAANGTLRHGYRPVLASCSRRKQFFRHMLKPPNS